MKNELEQRKWSLDAQLDYLAEMNEYTQKHIKEDRATLPIAKALLCAIKLKLEQRKANA